MKLFKWMKDGGPKSHVWGFFLAEIKPLFSVVLLRFSHGSREAYHSHAFNSISWVLKGKLREHRRAIGAGGSQLNIYTPSWRPVITTRSNMHKVKSEGITWVLSFRGPWIDRWNEYLPESDQVITLTHGRRRVA